MTDLPLPLEYAFEKMRLVPSQEGAEAIRDVVPSNLLLQDFRPITECLEWELSDLYWGSDGVGAFVGSGVPFLINNSGRLSEDIASLLFASCCEHRPQGALQILELGAGIGLFARYVLDAFQRICQQENADFYERLRYFVSDRSRRSVEQWVERDLFALHRDHVVLGTCDARAPRLFRELDGRPYALGDLRPVVCNYVLDVLPCAVVRRGASGTEELCVRTHLIDDPALLSQSTRLDVDAI